MGGNKGYPGLRARINQRAFQYASSMIGNLLNSEIQKARLPPISQCIPQVNGCLQVYNLYVSRYRCPQRIALYPAPPNRIVVAVENLDIGVTGNLGGQIVILLPIALFGIVQANLHQVSIYVDLTIGRTATGAPSIQVGNCNVQIGYADVYIENGGLVGDIANSQFRGRISSMVKEMAPSKICAQLPSIVNEKLNGRLGALPQTIALTQMASLFGSALGLGAGAQSSAPSAEYCTSSCGKGASTLTSSAPSAAPASLSGSSPIVGGAPLEGYNDAAGAKAPARKAVRAIPVYQTQAHHQHPQRHQLKQHRRTQRSIKFASNSTIDSLDPAALAIERAAIIRSFEAALDFVGAPKDPQNPVKEALNEVRRVKRQTVSRLRPAPPAVYHAIAPVYRKSRGSATGSYSPGSGPLVPPPPPVKGAPAPSLAPPPADMCAQCPAGDAAGDPANLLKQLASHLDLNRLSDMYLSTQLMNTYATNCDFTIDLVGEFSPYGQGGTPFGPFPTQFPGTCDGHMAEFILTDYTVNSLFYHMHRKGFISFRIGPDTPKFGELLKTTCSDDEDDELEDHGVELDEEDEERKKRKRRRHAIHDVIHHIAAHTVSKRAHKHIRRHNGKRGRRQDDAGGLADLGICFGDILPAVREKYPNQKISILIHTIRAPSVVLSGAGGGTAIIDLGADADIYIDGTNNKVGTITINAVVQITAQVAGNRISGHAEITQLQLRDNGGTLGLPQDALDNLGNLGKELLTKLANDALGKGVNINLPSTGALPFQVLNPQIQIVEHGLYVATDISINAAALGLSAPNCCPSC